MKRAVPLSVAVLAALDYRRRTGQGLYIDLSQYECGLQFIAPVKSKYPALKHARCSPIFLPFSHTAVPNCALATRSIASGVRCEPCWAAGLMQNIR